VASMWAAIRQLKLAWRPLDGAHEIPTGSFVARRGAGKRVAKDQIGPVHGILSICGGYNGVWAGIGSDPEVLDGLSQRDGGSAAARRR
jgi:hypothetical protein